LFVLVPQRPNFRARRGPCPPLDVFVFSPPFLLSHFLPSILTSFCAPRPPPRKSPFALPPVPKSFVFPLQTNVTRGAPESPVSAAPHSAILSTTNTPARLKNPPETSGPLGAPTSKRGFFFFFFFGGPFFFCLFWFVCFFFFVFFFFFFLLLLLCPAVNEADYRGPPPPVLAPSGWGVEKKKTLGFGFLSHQVMQA